MVFIFDPNILGKLVFLMLGWLLNIVVITGTASSMKGREGWILYHYYLHIQRAHREREYERRRTYLSSSFAIS